ncbi:MAG TPA: COX15/CtaA family protein [Acidimicrobiales bacterium]|nr:COX15/CtaA family protein [Acidimicrobiales bacterium]
MDRARAVSPSAYRRLTLAALWSLVFIVVTGAAVRLTESGLGCSTWPGCEPGDFVPRAESGLNPWIEFGNRLVTGAVSVAVALAVLGALRRVPRRRDLTLLSWGLVAGVIGQILLGALVVVVHVHPVAVQGHFVLSAVLVADAVILHHRAGLPDGPGGRAAAGPAPASPPAVRLARAVVALAAAVLLAGTLVTGSGPHAGDAEAERLSLSITRVAQVHSGLTWVLLATLVALGVRLRREAPGGVALERATALLTAVVLQGALGYLQYATGVPELLVGLHVLGSMLVWAAALRLLLALAAPLPRAAVEPGGGAREATTSRAPA